MRNQAQQVETPVRQAEQRADADIVDVGFLSATERVSTLTAQIIITLLKSDLPLQEVIHTVIGTLPICQVRKIAYATFTIVNIHHEDGRFNVMNFDNPPVMLYKKGRLATLPRQTEHILGNEVRLASGTLECGAFLVCVSDGIIHAGLGRQPNFGWSWENVSHYIEGLCITRPTSIREYVNAVISETEHLYQGVIGYDASCIGVHVRYRSPLMVFTGPPLDPKLDEACATRILEYPGSTSITKIRSCPATCRSAAN